MLAGLKNHEDCQRSKLWFITLNFGSSIISKENSSERTWKDG